MKSVVPVISLDGQTVYDCQTNPPTFSFNIALSLTTLLLSSTHWNQFSSSFPFFHPLNVQQKEQVSAFPLAQLN